MKIKICYLAHPARKIIYLFVYEGNKYFEMRPEFHSLYFCSLQTFHTAAHGAWIVIVHCNAIVFSLGFFLVAKSHIYLSITIAFWIMFFLKIIFGCIFYVYCRSLSHIFGLNSRSMVNNKTMTIVDLIYFSFVFLHSIDIFI